jgi:hypothetical protein
VIEWFKVCLSFVLKKCLTHSLPLYLYNEKNIEFNKLGVLDAVELKREKK